MIHSKVISVQSALFAAVLEGKDCDMDVICNCILISFYMLT